MTGLILSIFSSIQFLTKQLYIALDPQWTEARGDNGEENLTETIKKSWE